MTKKKDFEIGYVEHIVNLTSRNSLTALNFNRLHILLPLKLSDKLKFELENQKIKDSENITSNDIDNDDIDSINDAPDVTIEAVNSNDESMDFLIYDKGEPLRFLKRSKQSSNEDMHDRDESIYKRLCELGPVRKFCNPILNSEGFQRAFNELCLVHPNFREVIDYIFGILSTTRERMARVGPILLIGPPGVGKSCFAQDLAKALDITCLQIAMDSAMTKMSLVGSDRRYTNTAPGELFNLLCLGHNANPIIILDELDKVTLINDRENALTCLHGLLEPITAKKTHDLSTQVIFDASMIIWIATANDSEQIPRTIRSRFREFLILPATGDDAINVSLSVLQKVMSTTAPRDFNKTASRKVAVALAHLTAREIYQITESAIAHALSNGRKELSLSDFAADAHKFELDLSTLRRKDKDGKWLH